MGVKSELFDKEGFRYVNPLLGNRGLILFIVPSARNDRVENVGVRVTP